MYMNLKPNQSKRISFNTTTMASLGFIGPPPESFRSPPKTGSGGCYHGCPLSLFSFQLLLAAIGSLTQKHYFERI